MLKIIFLFCLFNLVSMICLGDDFMVRILNYPKQLHKGAPLLVTAEASNVSGKPIKVAVGGQYGFQKQIMMYWVDGRKWNPNAGTYIDWVNYHEEKELPVDWREAWTQEINYMQQTGALIVKAEVCAKGPFLKMHGGKIEREIKAWEGKIASDEFTVNIVEPIGEDKEAYDSFQACLRKPGKRDILQHCRNELLSNFPTSAYGGYALLAVLKGSHGFTWWETPYKNFGFYESAKRDYIAGHSVEMFERLLKANEEVIGLMEAFLKGGREDFAYTDELRANLAGRLAIQGKYERARSICETLIARKSTQEKNCSEFLQHLREKGYL